MNANELITLAEAANHFPRRNGKKVSILTLKRRIIDGCRGVKLFGVKDGHCWYTTLAAIREFQAACTEQATGQRREPTIRQPMADEVERILADRYGIRCE